MLTVIGLIAGLIIVVGALLMYSASKKGKASVPVKNSVEGTRTVGRAQGSGDN